MPLKHDGFSIAKLLLIGLVFHLVYIASVFDCYFMSPVAHGMKRFNAGSLSDARRLVLIVGDGLRADLLLNISPFPSIPNAPEIVAPHLRSILETRGAFGISHTRVPTESRPGHVALIGGMYEDVSAVTRGWKTNPVHFDSVFNQSSHTFSFGSPDILPMFAQGATPGKVDTWCYHEDDEDFTKDATALDIWVLDQLRTLFHNASTDASLSAHLHQEKTVFFLHLLGLDTTGHSYRPHSKEYMANIQVVDSIVRQTEAMFSEFYKDESTSFVFTADHGMSKIGNHGDGDPDNTRTPLIAWGAGVRGPLPDTTPSSHDEYSAPWGLSHLLRQDVDQADIAALMSALIGIDWPVNSVGVLPDVDPTRPGYLRSEGKGQARAALINAQVLLEHYRVKHVLKKTHSLFYKPFPYFSDDSEWEHTPGIKGLANITQLLATERYNDARKASAELIKQALAGLRYLETYDRSLIRGIVISAYLGWIAFSAAHILPEEFVQPLQSTFVLNAVSAVILVAFWASFALQKSPATFYAYMAFPVYFWRHAIKATGGSVVALTKNPAVDRVALTKVIVRGCLVVAALQSMVVAYTHRSIWSIGFVIMGLVWPLLTWPTEMTKEDPYLFPSWAGLCTITAIFPLLPVDKAESVMLILAGGFVMLHIGIWALISNKDRKEDNPVFISQCVLILLSVIITYSSISNLQAKLGLPLVNQIAGWATLTIASVVPFLRPGSGSPISKGISLFLGSSVCFVILSISVEGLFFTSYSALMFFWPRVETGVRKFPTLKTGNLSGHHPQWVNIRTAIFFLFFVQVAFFGTGNVASISSFYLEPVYRLVPIFNPFLMASLLIFKIIIPYIILGFSFAYMNQLLNLPPFSLFLIALTLTDVMTITFFLNVTDTGSWLEIGQSISFFCISSLLLVWSAGICALGEHLIGNTKQSSPQKSRID